MYLNPGKIDELLAELGQGKKSLQEAVSEGTVTNVFQGRSVTVATAERIRKWLEQELRLKREDPHLELSLKTLLLTDRAQAQPDPEAPKTLVDDAATRAQVMPAPAPSEDDRKRKRWRIPLPALIVAAVPLLAVVAIYIRSSSSESDKRTAGRDSSATHIRQPKANESVGDTADVCLTADGSKNNYIVVNWSKVYHSFGPVASGECQKRIPIGNSGDEGKQFDIFIAVPEGKMPENGEEIAEEKLPKKMFPPVRVTRSK